MSLDGTARRLLLLAVSLTFARSALATPTALNCVPTADVVGRDSYTVEVEAVGHTTPFDRGAEYWLLTGLGLGDRAEVGANRLLSRGDGRTSVDAKLQLLRREGGDFAVAVGATDLTRWDRDSSAWYVVGSRDCGAIRATVGLQRDSNYRMLVGFAHSLTDKLCLQADWTTGTEGDATVGLGLELGGGWQALTYYARSNSSRSDDFFGLNFAWNGQWCRRCESPEAGATLPGTPDR